MTDKVGGSGSDAVMGRCGRGTARGGASAVRWVDGARALVVATCTVGCSGTAPTVFELALRLYPEADTTPAVVEWELDALRLQRCDTSLHGQIVGFREAARPRRFVPVAVQSAIGGRLVTDGRDLGFDVPAGPWCAAELVPAAPLRWTGELAGVDADLTLDVPPVRFEVDAWATPRRVGGDRGRVVVDDAIIEVGGPSWLGGLAPEDGAVVVEPGDARHDDVVAALFDGTATIALYEAGDADGLLTDAERAQGPLDVGDAIE